MERLQAIAQENDIYSISYDLIDKVYTGTIFHPKTGAIYKKLVGQTEGEFRKNLIDWLYSNDFRMM